jgi:hypothetical protein
MGTSKNIPMVLFALAAIFIFAGCSSMGYMNKNQLSVDDIITMSNAGVNKDVIMQHIDSTHSRYKLSAADIVKLTQAKVDKDVINKMIKSGNQPHWYDSGYYSWGYPYWDPYGGYPYWRSPYWGYPYHSYWWNWYYYPYGRYDWY